MSGQELQEASCMLECLHLSASTFLHALFSVLMGRPAASQQEPSGTAPQHECLGKKKEIEIFDFDEIVFDFFTSSSK